MKKLSGLFLLFVLMSAASLQAQSATKDDTHRNYKVTTQQKAEYPGGNEALYRFFYEEMKYPEAAKKERVEGDVQVSFYVMPDSSVSDVRALNDLGHGTKAEAERLIKSTKWVPAIQNGRSIKQQMVVPVLFRIYD